MRVDVGNASLHVHRCAADSLDLGDAIGGLCRRLETDDSDVEPCIGESLAGSSTDAA